MTDLFKGQTCTESYKFLSGGAAKSFTFNFDADKAVFYNLTDWTGTAGGKPISLWFKDQTTEAHAYQQSVVDTAATQSFNFLDTETNGFTVANTVGGPESFFALIGGVTRANPCVITTTQNHGFQTGQTVMITDLGNVGTGIPSRGMDELNNSRFLIEVLSATTFSLKDVVSSEPIDSSGFVSWVSGGRITLETRVIRLNNPSTAPYMENPFTYDPVKYILTAGTSVMGSSGDVFRIEVIKYGDTFDLGQV